jgi:hypothetical protein
MRLKNPTVSTIDTLIIAVILISLVSVFMLSLEVFIPKAAILTALLLETIIFYTLRIKLEKTSRRTTYALAGILLIALLFRFDPFFIQSDGGDAGIYHKMSEVFKRERGPIAEDKVRSDLQDPKLLQLYDSNNQDEIKSYKPGQYEGMYSAGIFIKNLAHSEYIFRFYPLHPIWMSIFSDLFGMKNSVYSVVFFSLISLIFIYYISLDLLPGYRQATIALLISLLFCTHPLLVYFSKLPMSETPNLAFSLGGLYYLIRVHKYKNKREDSWLGLVLSAGMFSCLFFTRVTGFLYVPALTLVWLGSILSIDDKKTRIQFNFYIIYLYLAFALSLLYGYYYTYPYLFNLYHGVFDEFKITPPSRALFILFLFCFFLVVSSFIMSSEKWLKLIKKRSHFIVDSLCNLNILCILLTTLCTLYDSYRLGFTKFYDSDSWPYKADNIVGLGLNSIIHSSVITIGLYVGPILYLLFFISIVRLLFKQQKGFLFLVILSFLNIFFFYGTIVQRTVLFFLYARYQSSEIIPLFTSLFLANTLIFTRRGKVALITIYSVTLIYFAYFSFYQFQGSEGGGDFYAFSKVASHLSEKDLIFIIKEEFPKNYVFRRSLSFDFGKKAMEIASESQLHDFYPVIKNTPNVFLLSFQPRNKDFLILVDTIFMKSGRYMRGHNLFPTQLWHWEFSSYLYKVDREKLMTKFGSKSPN